MECLSTIVPRVLTDVVVVASIENLLHVSPILTVAYYTPLAAGGVVISCVGGTVLHRVSGTVLLLISGAGYIACVLLFAVLPAGGSLTVKYWAFIMPAMLASTIGIDTAFNVTIVFITTSVPAICQGAAGALAHSLLFLGVGFWLSIANIAVSGATAARGLDMRDQYRVGFWLGVGLAGLAFACFCCVRVGRAKSDLTADEKAAAAAAAASVAASTSAVAFVEEEEKRRQCRRRR